MEPIAPDPVPAVAAPLGNAADKAANEAQKVSATAVESKPTPSDGELVERTLGGDRSAFDQLIVRYQRQAVAVSYRLLGNSHDAMEVSQDAFMKSFSSLATLQKGDAFGGWLMRIVSNLSLNYRRSRKSKSQLPLDDMLGPTDPQQTDSSAGSDWMAQSGDPVRKLESEEMGRRLQEALAQLPEKQRLALTMFTIDELPQKEVAAALNCSVEAVKWHVFQGRKKLKDLLKDHI